MILKVANVYSEDSKTLTNLWTWYGDVASVKEGVKYVFPSMDEKNKRLDALNEYSYEFARLHVHKYHKAPIRELVVDFNDGKYLMLYVDGDTYLLNDSGKTVEILN